MHLPSKLLSERSSKSENLLKILPRSFGITLALGHYRGRLEGQQNEDIIDLNLRRGDNWNGCYRGFAVAGVTAALQDGEHQ
jgi:hypothetical protein